MDVKIVKTFSKEIIFEGNLIVGVKKIFIKKNEGYPVKILSNNETIYMGYNNTFTDLKFSIWRNEPIVVATYNIYRNTFSVNETLNAEQLEIIAAIVTACAATVKMNGNIKEIK